MTTSLTRDRVIAALLVLALAVGGIVWWRHRQAEQRRQSCADMYAYSMYLDRQGYSGPIRDPEFLANQKRCFG